MNGFEFGSSGSSSSSGGGIPVGGLMPLADSVSPIYTSGGADYLRTGILMPIAGYSALENTNPWMTANLGTSNGTALPIASQTVRGVGTRWYTFGSGQSQMMTGINGTWAAQSTDTHTGQGDVCIAGTKVIRTKSGTAGAFTHSAGTVNTSGGFSSSLANNICASNPAGTLSVVGFNSGNTYTTTDAINFSLQTATGVSATSFTNGEWSTAFNGFLFLGNDAKIYSTTNGVAFTNKGLVITGATGASVSGQTIFSDYRAYSPTSNVFITTLTVNGVSDVYVIRTDGTTHTATKLSSALNLDFRQTVSADTKVRYIGTQYFIIGSAKSGDPTTQCYKSNDDGITWIKATLPVNPTNTSAPVGQIEYGNSTYISVTNDATKSIAVHSGTSATHIGITQKSDNLTSGGATFPNYVRVR